ncbi:MAG: hypothetical protein JSW11_20575 [Candidatus Heimdallarchaeota archaeon]|nr:MAG: hypothetical protein JSW11_20575 [Candidatus Heimdallarchaeota archaeon]
MKYNIVAIIAGIGFTLVIVGAIVIIPDLLVNIPTEPNGNNGNHNGDKFTIGSRIASYIESRSSDILFTWSYNNSIVNVNFTYQVGDYVDGVLTYGSHINGSVANVSLVGVFGSQTEEISSSTLDSIFTKFEIAIEDLNETSDTITGLGDITPCPPTFVWDIAFNDNTSISLMYSKDQHVLAAINGTWTASEYGLSGEDIIEFPQFEYEYHSQEVPLPFLILDETAEQHVLDAVNTYVDLVSGPF